MEFIACTRVNHLFTRVKSQDGLSRVESRVNEQVNEYIQKQEIKNGLFVHGKSMSFSSRSKLNRPKVELCLYKRLIENKTDTVTELINWMTEPIEPNNHFQEGHMVFIHLLDG